MPAYLTETKQPDECEYVHCILSSASIGVFTYPSIPCVAVVAIPAPVITKTKARDMNNVLTEPPERDEDKVDEEYTEPWDEPPPKA